MNEEELLGNAIHSPLAQDVSAVLGEIWWLFLVLGLFMLFKETMKSFVTSIMVLRGGDYRMGIWKTTFYVYHINSEGKMFFTERSIMNEQLPNVQIEIPQQRMDQIIPAGFFDTMPTKDS